MVNISIFSHQIVQKLSYTKITIDTCANILQKYDTATLHENLIFITHNMIIHPLRFTTSMLRVPGKVLRSIKINSNISGNKRLLAILQQNF